MLNVCYPKAVYQTLQENTQKLKQTEATTSSASDCCSGRQ